MNSAEEIVKDKKGDIVSIAHDQTILKACQVMIDNKIGAVLVTKDGEFVGIWTERDLMRNSVTPGFDPETCRVGDYMTTPLHTAAHTTQLHKLEEMFLGLFVRHLVVDKEGEYIGLISIGDVLRANLLEKDERFKQCNDFVHWEHYEKWQWGRPKKMA